MWTPPYMTFDLCFPRHTSLTCMQPLQFMNLTGYIVQTLNVSGLKPIIIKLDVCLRCIKPPASLRLLSFSPPLSGSSCGSPGVPLHQVGRQTAQPGGKVP